MKIVLIVCPCWTIHQPPLGAAYLVAYLRSKGHEVRALDLGIDLYTRVEEKYRYMFEMGENSYWMHRFTETRKLLDLDRIVDNWADMILDTDAKIVGFSMYSTTTQISLLLAQRIKKKDKDKIIVFGGPSCLREDQAYDFIKKDFVDAIIVGEGEVTLGELINSLENRSYYCPGAIVKHDGEIIDCGDKPPIRHLDKLPFPDFKDFTFERYSEPFSIPILTSRGCPGKCTFCAERNSLGASFRWRSAENVFEEFKYQKTVDNYSNFCMVDSTINGNLHELEKLCNYMIEKELKISWGGKARIRPEMHKEFFRKMRKAGCGVLDYGIESASQRVLDDMQKMLDIKCAGKVLKDTYESGIMTNCFFIIGYPTETRLDFLRSIIFVIKNRRHMSRVMIGSGCGIPPGSYLYSRLKDYDIVMEEGSYSSWYTKNGTNTYRERKRRLAIFKSLSLIPSINIELCESSEIPLVALYRKLQHSLRIFRSCAKPMPG